MVWPTPSWSSSPALWVISRTLGWCLSTANGTEPRRSSVWSLQEPWLSFSILSLVSLPVYHFLTPPLAWVCTKCTGNTVLFCTFLNKYVMMVDLVSCVMTGEGPQIVLITQTLLIEGRCNYSLEKSLHKGTLFSKHGSSAVLTERLFCQVTTCLSSILPVNGEASL